ncbi:MAG TPA: GNAT family N-acetyltransferase [Bacillota bacterium]|nr:GNAT family N-acetyltransferase [Bacillota bacterium]
MELRRFNDGDIDECTTLFLSVFSKEPWNDQWSSFDHAKTYLSEIVGSPGFLGFVAVEEDKIVGACLGRRKTWWSGPEYYIDEFFIDTGLQGKGFGTKLINHIKAAVLADGMRAIILLTDRGLPAARFYGKNGFFAQPQYDFYVL